MLPVSWREVGIPYKCPETTKLRIPPEVAERLRIPGNNNHASNSRLARRGFHDN
jgi:hypothetical protein